MTQSIAHTPTFMLDYMNYDPSSCSAHRGDEIVIYAGIYNNLKKDLISSIGRMMVEDFGLENRAISETNAYRTEYYRHINPNDARFQLDLDNPFLRLNKAKERWEIVYTELGGARSCGIPLNMLDMDELMDLFGALAESDEF